MLDEGRFGLGMLSGLRGEGKEALEERGKCGSGLALLEGKVECGNVVRTGKSRGLSQPCKRGLKTELSLRPWNVLEHRKVSELQKNIKMSNSCVL